MQGLCRGHGGWAYMDGRITAAVDEPQMNTNEHQAGVVGDAFGGRGCNGDGRVFSALRLPLLPRQAMAVIG
jgi:hypothetical protein